MGCGSSRVDNLDVSVRQVSDNPAKGLPNLLTFMKDHDQEGQGAKNVPAILNVLPQALEGLKAENSKPLLAACDVIVQCVKLHNNGGSATIINDDIPKQCQQQLVMTLKKVEAQAAKSQAEASCDCETSTKEAKSIALAVISLFKLVGHSTRCKEEFTSSGGLESTIALIQLNSGIKVDAKQRLVSMLCELVNNCGEGVDSVVDSGGVKELRKCVEAAKENNIPKGMQLECCKVLEACVLNGTKLEGKDEIQKTIKNCRTYDYA